MQIRYVCEMVFLSAMISSPAAGGGNAPKYVTGDNSSITNAQASSGLKEALSQSVTTAVVET
jgi:hypothetical protein